MPTLYYTLEYNHNAKKNSIYQVTIDKNKTVKNSAKRRERECLAILF